MRHESRVLALALLSALPWIVAVAALLWWCPLGPLGRGGVVVVATAGWIPLALRVRRAVLEPLQTLANLLAALHEGDFTFRAHVAGKRGALVDVHREVNALADTLREQRLGAREASALLRTVMDAIDVAVFAFDDSRRLRLVNRAGESLLGERGERMMGRSVDEVGLAFSLDGETPRIVDLDLPGGGGRWEVRRADWRQGGLPLDLVVLSNVSRALREEERQAWQRLVRVLGHELNNSLAPIRSIAGSLAALLTRDPRPSDWLDDARSGLAVVEARADALGRFLGGYATLARLPAPQLEPLDLEELVRHVTRLEPRVNIRVAGGEAVSLDADPVQIEQLLINLLKNAAEAVLETGGGVSIGWTRTRGPQPFVTLWIDDDGPGIANAGNLFVPFFTTKPQGSGIGLALARQIAESHGGTVALTNRGDSRGARALLRLPVSIVAVRDQTRGPAEPE